MPTQISKTELLELLETDDGLEYEGRIQINTEMRLYYRTRVNAGDNHKGFIVVYVVE